MAEKLTGAERFAVATRRRADIHGYPLSFVLPTIWGWRVLRVTFQPCPCPRSQHNTPVYRLQASNRHSHANPPPIAPAHPTQSRNALLSGLGRASVSYPR